MRLLNTAALVILAACAIACAVADLRLRYWQWQKRRELRLRDAHEHMSPKLKPGGVIASASQRVDWAPGELLMKRSGEAWRMRRTIFGEWVAVRSPADDRPSAAALINEEETG